MAGARVLEGTVVQLGFVIDHSRCIGCHACTVACKAENDVPLGSFRTWVKHVEHGAFPSVKRSFAVLRCNQCSEAPCVTICPVRALSKRPDGIVDVDPAACIGCKACMQGCPYDALYINDATGTAEKCHFCAHRAEIGLAPACAVICPTEAIVPGDFDDPHSAVSRLAAARDLRARKVEAGTGPNVLYREVAEAGIDPRQTTEAAGYQWADRLPGPRLDAARFEALEAEAESRARTTYDVDHPVLWGSRVTAYLFAKALAAGIVLALPALVVRAGPARPPAALLAGLGIAALLFLVLTTALLVADLKRPERFLFILLRPNPDSWLARGAVVLASYGAAASAWTVAVLLGGGAGAWPAATLTVSVVLAALAACYTGWLFGQARGRVLWMRRGLWLVFLVQSLAAGGAFVLLLAPVLRLEAPAAGAVRRVLLAALALLALLVVTEGRMAPPGRQEEYERALRLITHGPYARRRWGLGIVAGIAIPALLLLVPGSPLLGAVAAALVLVGLWVEDDVLVRAGQALPIS